MTRSFEAVGLSLHKLHPVCPLQFLPEERGVRAIGQSLEADESFATHNLIMDLFALSIVKDQSDGFAIIGPYGDSFRKWVGVG